jgi:quinol-cytochrome oxidoreductase complex cytochrome b subunit
MAAKRTAKVVKKKLYPHHHEHPHHFHYVMLTLVMTLIVIGILLGLSLNKIFPPAQPVPYPAHTMPTSSNPLINYTSTTNVP